MKGEKSKDRLTIKVFSIVHRSQSEFTTKELVQDNSLKTIDKLTIIDDRQQCRPFDSQHIVFFDLVYQIVG